MTDTAGERNLIELLRLLRTTGYTFVTPTPATHARVLGRRPGAAAEDLRDALGWSLPFRSGTIDRRLEDLLREANALRPSGELLRSTVRVSSLGAGLFVHSAYPTDEADAVFFGPDSYRFARAIRADLSRAPLAAGQRILDIGTGSGVGAIVAAGECPGCEALGTDINARALAFARVNAISNGVELDLRLGRDAADADGRFDFVVANPPFIVDDKGRAYRDGGGSDGAEIALGMVRAALPRLAPGGRLLLYTGSTIVAGRDALRQALENLARQEICTIRYEEVDPDIFGEELDNLPYRHVERIAAVTAVFQRTEY